MWRLAENFSRTLWENEGTPEGTYIGMVRHNIDTIVKALAVESTAASSSTTEY